MLVGDLILVGRKTFRVTGIYLGAVGVQNLVGMKSLALRAGSAHGQTVKEMLVPEELVKGLPLYRLIEDSRPRPTIAELEQILNSEDDAEIVIRPDGSVYAE